MPLELLLLIQSAIAPGFDLGRLPRDAPRYGEGEGGDIVVCARKREPGQQVGIVLEAPDLLPKAELKLFGDVRANLHGEAVRMPAGVQSTRIMATVKIPF